jgi:hypothetical protein
MQLGMVLHTCNPSGKQENYKLKASLGFITRPCLNQTHTHTERERERERERKRQRERDVYVCLYLIFNLFNKLKE